MNWEERIIDDEELSAHSKNGSAESLRARAAALIEHQKGSWPMLAGGYRAMAQVETKSFMVAESHIVVQHNPGRIRSTSASVDRGAVAARGCFLCPESLPEEEKGIACPGDFIILCNPFPVLDNHLSIVHREHVPQSIEGNIEKLLDLACALGPEFFVLYNGPECGASAPDHLHFQACSRRLLPIYSDLAASEETKAEHCEYCEEAASEGFELFTLDNCGRAVIVYRGNRSEEISGWVYRTLEKLPPGAEHREPAFNIVCTYERSVWTVFLFPRSRHRPACFYAEGDARLLVSPGAIDMAGVIVVPERSHFERIDAQVVSKIYSEVSPDVERVNDLIRSVCESPVVEGSLSGWS
jgi:hypothetical protein